MCAIRYITYEGEIFRDGVPCAEGIYYKVLVAMALRAQVHVPYVSRRLKIIRQTS